MKSSLSINIHNLNSSPSFKKKLLLFYCLNYYQQNISFPYVELYPITIDNTKQVITNLKSLFGVSRYVYLILMTLTILLFVTKILRAWDIKLLKILRMK